MILSPHALWTVARVEVKTLLRSWFFRIFAGIIVGILTFFNIVMFSGLTGMPWMFRAIPVSIPYMNILYLNLIQAVVAVFLASDFLKRDRRLDSTDVVYMRSMSNADYVVGKTVGILLVFGGLNVAVLLIALLFNTVFADVPVIWNAYVLYPLIISLPALVYILGLSFLLMAVVGNQAVTLIVLLGYIGTSLIYLGPRVHVLYDYMAFHLPLLYSGLVGFGNGEEIVLHRGMYLLLGLAGILGAVRLLKRLPQSRAGIRLSSVLAFLFLAAAAGLGVRSVDRILDSREMRDSMRAVNDRLGAGPRVSMKRCTIDMRHEGSTIRCGATIHVRNETEQSIDRYRFSLNPALAVQSVRSGGEALAVRREMHVLEIDPLRPLPPGGIDSLVFVYSGAIDERVCYLDVDDKETESVARLVMYPVDRRFAFITPGFVLLTPETLWYPTPRAQYAPARPTEHDREFTDFSLAVTTEPGLTVFSQGERDSTSEGTYIFTPETPLTGLTLCIGAYETRSVTVDSITYTLALREGHDTFTPFFSGVADSVPALIREIKEDFERPLELMYPFPRLALVEVPIQFESFRRLWTVQEETVQPELVLLPERGAPLPSVDFKRRLEGPRRRGRRRDMQLSPREQQARIFREFINLTIAGTIQGESGRRRGGGMESTTFNVFSNYYSHCNYLRSPRLPILDTALEAFLLGRITQPTDPMFKSFIGLTGAEKANIALREHSLADILADGDRKEIHDDVLKVKGRFLFVLLQERIGTETFNGYLAGLLSGSRFRAIDAEELIGDLRDRFGVDLNSFIESWYRDVALPGYLVGDVASYQVMDGDRTRFQVTFTVSNTEPVAGYLHLSFRAGEQRRRFFMGGDEGESVERFVSLAGNETKKFGVLLDFKPNIMIINTLISRNIPTALHVSFVDFELDERAKPFDGERVLDAPVDIVEAGAIVVDNEDGGFAAEERGSRRFFGLRPRRAADREEEKYENIRYWEPPGGRWVPTTHTDFFGRYVRSALYTKGGSGDLKVSWSATIPASGTYDVYYHVSTIRPPWRRREENLGAYHFNIAHDDGVDAVELNINEAPKGWNYLGSYYLSAGDASVELTNESNGNMVIADAVKWVKR